MREIVLNLVCSMQKFMEFSSDISHVDVLPLPSKNNKQPQPQKEADKLVEYICTLNV